MANSYKSGKWSGTLSADLKGDASKTTPTIDIAQFDEELANLKQVQGKINAKIKQIKSAVNTLKNDSETGKMATTYLGYTIKRLDKISSSLDTEITRISNAVNKAYKDEFKRMYEIVKKWEAAQNSGAGK